MSFVFIHTGYLRHPKLVGLPAGAVLLHLASILWTAEHLTDGYVPESALTELGHTVNNASRWHRRNVQQLVNRGLWDELPNGWHVHDFEDWNRSSTREVVEANRTAARDRQRRHRDSESRRD